MKFFENFFVSMIKGTIMTVTMKGGYAENPSDEVIKGQFELVTVDRPGFRGNGDPQACLFTDRKDDYEYFPLKDIISVLVEREGNNNPINWVHKKQERPDGEKNQKR